MTGLARAERGEVLSPHFRLPPGQRAALAESGGALEALACAVELLLAERPVASESALRSVAAFGAGRRRRSG